MNKQNSSSHLRLIVSSVQHTEAAKQESQELQLALPYPETSTVYFLLIDALEQREFSRIIKDFSPRWIVDVRTVPRLDTIAPSRSAAFDLFKEIKSSYIDLFGRLKITSYRTADANPTFWINELIELLRKSDAKGPYLLLFDNQSLMRAVEPALHGKLEPIIGKAANFAYIP